MFLWWPSIKIVQAIWIRQKHGHRGGRGRGLFSLYIYIENFEFCQKPLDQFLYNLAKMFPCWSSTKIVQAIMVCQKTLPQGGGAYFPYISVQKTLIILLSETTGPIWVQHCRNVSLVTVYQDCSSSWFIKKRGDKGAGPIFPMYLNRKF